MHLRGARVAFLAARARSSGAGLLSACYRDHTWTGKLRGNVPRRSGNRNGIPVLIPVPTTERRQRSRENGTRGGGPRAPGSRVVFCAGTRPSCVLWASVELVYSLHRLGTAHTATRLHCVMAPHAHHAAARPLARPLWVRHGGPVGHTRRTDCTRLYRLCHAIESRPPTITSACR